MDSDSEAMDVVQNGGLDGILMEAEGAEGEGEVAAGGQAEGIDDRDNHHRHHQHVQYRRSQPPPPINNNWFGNNNNDNNNHQQHHLQPSSSSQSTRRSSTNHSQHPSASATSTAAARNVVKKSSSASSSAVTTGGQSAGNPEVTATNRHFHNTSLMESAFTNLKHYRQSGQLCDVVLVAGPSPEERAESEIGEGGDDRLELPAHKVILASGSEYFCAMFAGDMTEAKQSRVYIQGVSPVALRLLIDYMYTSRIDINQDNVQILLPAASLLQLNEVRDACCEFLQSQLHPSNCLGISAFADLHSCTQLLHYASTFTEQHFGDIVQSEEFVSLNANQVCRLISSDRLTTTGEEKVFESVIHWVRHDPEKRRSDLPRLMEHVRLPLLGKEYLVEKIDKEPLIVENKECLMYCIEAMKFHLMNQEKQMEFQSPRVKPRQPLGLPKLMVVIGGQAPKAIRNVDVYDFQSEKWIAASELPQRRCRCGVAVLNGLVYAVGGFNGSLRVRTVDVYDPMRDIWSGTGAMEARRSTLGVAVLDNRIFAVGGFDGSTGLSSCEALDPRSGEWSLRGAMSTRRSSVGVGVLDGYLYAVGGYDGQSRQCLNTVERYDVRADKWMPAPDMNTRRSGAGVTVIDGKLFAVGGHDGPSVRKSAEMFNPVTDTWTPIADMSLSRRNAGVVSLNGELYAVGGDDGSSNLASVELYQPKANEWAMLRQPMLIGRSYAGVAIITKNANS